MTQMQDAFAVARRLTRVEKRNITRKPNFPRGERDENFPAILAEAKRREADKELFTVLYPARATQTHEGWEEPDLGLSDPEIVQARPNTLLSRPSRDPKRTQAFAKTADYDPSYAERVEASQRRLINKFGRVPDKVFIAPDPGSKKEAAKAAANRLEAICAAEDERRAPAPAQCVFLQRVIQFVEEQDTHEYCRNLRPIAQARAWRV